MNEVSFPKNTTIATKMIEHNAKKMELGLMGKLFGGGSEKSGNIAAFVLIFCFLALIVVLVEVPSLVQTYARDVVTGIFSLVTLTIGYIFGKNDSS